MPERVKYASLCIEVDFRKILVSKFELLNRVYNVEYEGLHLVCFECGRYGHRKELCPILMPKLDADVPKDGERVQLKPQVVSGRRTNSCEGEQNFRPWMLVQKDVGRRKMVHRQLGKQFTTAHGGACSIPSCSID